MNSQTLQQAISFLTTPLSRTSIPLPNISRLQTLLFASLSALATQTSSIVIRLSSNPPEYISHACDTTGINWSEWLFLLGGGLGLDLDVYIHPGIVNVCFRKHGSPSSGLVTVWQSEEPKITTKELLAYDDDSDLFALINQKVHSPSWVSSWTTTNHSNVAPRSVITAPVAVPKLQPVPLSAKTHSRSSSYASSTHSNSSSASYGSNHDYNGMTGYSFGRDSGSSGSSSSIASNSPPSSTYSLSEEGDCGGWGRRGTIVPGPAQSAMMAARQAHAQQQHAQQYAPAAPHTTEPVYRSSSSSSGGSVNGSTSSKHRRNRSNCNNASKSSVTVDSNKASVTAYDGGKTKVMTGGVMLGPGPTKKRTGF